MSTTFFSKPSATTAGTKGATAATTVWYAIQKCKGGGRGTGKGNGHRDELGNGGGGWGLGTGMGKGGRE